MKQCRMDCIHIDACRRFADNSTYWNSGDCPIYKSAADVAPKSEVEKLEHEIETLKDNNEHLAVMLEETKIELEAMRGAANSYKMHYENLARKIFMDIDRVVEKYSMGDIEYPAIYETIKSCKNYKTNSFKRIWVYNNARMILRGC